MTSTPPTPPSSSPSSPSSPPRLNPFSPTPPSTPGGSPPRPSSPPGSLFSRLGARASYDYIPMHDTLVMFDMHDAAPAVYEMLGITPPIKDNGTSDPTDTRTLIAALDKDKALSSILRAQLDQFWTDFKIVGAVHVYDWREEVKQAATNRLNALKQRPNFVRAADPLLIVNVLARARSYLLIHGAALALDRPFLERIVMTDDPRLLSVVTAGQHIVDSLVPPPPPDDVFEDLDEDDK